MLHYTAFSERMLMKAPVFSSSLDDMRAMSHFYSSPLLPLWPLPLARPPFCMWRPACPRITDGSLSLNWFVQMTALANTPPETVRLPPISHWQPRRPHWSANKKAHVFYSMHHRRWKALCCLATGSALCLSPQRQMLRMKMVPEWNDLEMLTFGPRNDQCGLSVAPLPTHWFMGRTTICFAAERFRMPINHHYQAK